MRGRTRKLRGSKPFAEGFAEAYVSETPAINMQVEKAAGYSHRSIINIGPGQERVWEPKSTHRMLMGYLGASTLLGLEDLLLCEFLI